jgi:hypothetical protein
VVEVGAWEGFCAVAHARGFPVVATDLWSPLLFLALWSAGFKANHLRRWPTSSPNWSSVLAPWVLQPWQKFYPLLACVLSGDRRWRLCHRTTRLGGSVTGAVTSKPYPAWATPGWTWDDTAITGCSSSRGQSISSSLNVISIVCGSRCPGCSPPSS